MTMSINFEFLREERRPATWVPAVDVCERPSEVVILAEMPGVHRNELCITWVDGVLTISGSKRRQGEETGAARYLCVERTYSQFERKIEIKIPIDHTQGRAELRNGLLTIRLPKAARREASVIPVA